MLCCEPESEFFCLSKDVQHEDFPYFIRITQCTSSIIHIPCGTFSILTNLIIPVNKKIITIKSCNNTLNSFVLNSFLFKYDSQPRQEAITMDTINPTRSAPYDDTMFHRFSERLYD